MTISPPGSGNQRTVELGEICWGPIEVGNQHVAEGWWTDETVGDLITGWLQADSGLGVFIHERAGDLPDK